MKLKGGECVVTNERGEKQNSDAYSISNCPEPIYIYMLCEGLYGNMLRHDLIASWKIKKAESNQAGWLAGWFLRRFSFQQKSFISFTSLF